MFSIESFTITNVGLALAVLVWARILLHWILPSLPGRSHHASVKHIPGPPPSSWIFGNMRELELPSEYGQYEFGWLEKYGLVYRVKGCFGVDRLMISDPEALRHILADTSTFIRSPHHQRIVRMLVGEYSVLHAMGDDHRRIRAVMNPAFSAANIRALPPVIQRVATKMADQWKESASKTGGAVINISPILQRAALDIIGEAILGVPFNTLDNDDSELARTHLHILALVSARSMSSVLLDSIMSYMPSTILRLALLAPTAALRHLRRLRELAAKIATELIEAKEDAFDNGLETESDLMSLLVNANGATTDSSKKMSFVEMRDQVANIMLAGQETTATTISWALYELAKDPAAQAKLRAEISESYAVAHSRGEHELSYADLEGMAYLNAFIKEILRVYAVAPMLERAAAEDAVLPLSKPIVTTTGQHLTELPIKKGQLLIITIAAYNQAASIWGPDAKEFRPSRWMAQEDAAVNDAALGPYANLLTFLGGPRACIGWRLAVTEIQVVMTELIRKLSFSVPAGVAIRKELNLTVVPMTGDEGHEEQGLPLLVTLLE